jgi:hypothetical protein
MLNKKIILLLFVFLLLLAIQTEQIKFVSASKDLVFIKGPNCDGKTITLETEYTGNSSIYASNINVWNVQGNTMYPIKGTWSKNYLQNGDRSDFTSFELNNFLSLNIKYTVQLDTNNGVWSDEVNFYCINPYGNGKNSVGGNQVTCWYYDGNSCIDKLYPGHTECPANGFMEKTL